MFSSPQCVILLTLLTLTLAQGQYIKWGKCPKISALQDFNMTAFEGVWYELERTFSPSELSASCIQLELKQNNDHNSNNSISANNTRTATHLDPSYEIIIKTVNRMSGSASALAGVAKPVTSGSSIFEFKRHSLQSQPNALIKALTFTRSGGGRYVVLGTDYTRYGVLWSCSSLGVLHTDQFWILGRNSELTAEDRADIYSTVKGLGLDYDRLTLVRQRDCLRF